MRSRFLWLAICALLLVPISARAAAASALPSIGSTQVVQGIAVKLVSVERSHEAGAADYVAGKGNVFLLVSIQILRKGGHDTYAADPADFTVQTSNGNVIDSETFGFSHEFQIKHLYTQPLSGMIGFEVPANDKHLLLLWQPELASSPDAQAEWMIGSAGKTIQYAQ